jgi:hypothetical protein
MAVENFSTYTVVDPGSDLTVTSTKITGVQVTGLQDEYVYYDYGANYFDGLNVDFELYIADGGVNVYGLGGIAITNTLQDIIGAADTDIEVVGADRGGVGVAWIRFLRGNFVEESRWSSATVDTLYYCKLSRTAGSGTATVKVYASAADRTADTNELSGTLTLTGLSTTKYRYSMGFINNGADGYLFSGYVQNMDLNIVAGGATRTPRYGFIHLNNPAVV